METEDLRERLLEAWVGINGILKDSRMTKRLTYNEAIVMRLTFKQYQIDHIGQVSVQHILKQTNMLKSIVNRTINSLCTQGFLIKEQGISDRRNLFVRLVPEKLPEFLTVHQHSLEIVDKVIHMIGEEDAAVIVRCWNKLATADLQV